MLCFLYLLALQGLDDPMRGMRSLRRKNWQYSGFGSSPPERAFFFFLGCRKRVDAWVLYRYTVMMIVQPHSNSKTDIVIGFFTNS